MAENFEKGDFITWINKQGAFGIYEGIDLEPSATYCKKFTLAAFYDPTKYVDTPQGYRTVANLDVGTKEKPCAKTIDTYKEDYWWHKASEKEKEEALKILETFGYFWDEKTLSLREINCGGGRVPAAKAAAGVKGVIPR